MSPVSDPSSAEQSRPRPIEAAKVLPWNRDAEESALGVALESEDAARLVVAELSEEDVCDPRGKRVFRVIEELLRSGVPPDTVTVGDRLKADGDNGLKSYLYTLVNQVPTISSARHYIAIVQKNAALRRFIAAADEARDGAMRGEPLDALRATLVEASAVGAGGDGVGTVERYGQSRVEWASLFAGRTDASEWMVEPMLPRGRAIATYAPAKAGKSLLALDVSASLATGRRVLDRAGGTPATILYIDLEMTEDDLRERLEDMGYGPDDDLSRLHYYLLPDLPPLDTAAGGRDLRDLAAAHDAEVVVIDTTTSATTGAENDADTIRAYWQHCGRLLKGDGRTVWRIDHAGKDLKRGQRGTSHKAGDVDVVWELTVRDGTSLRLQATHRRVRWVPDQVDLVRFDDPLRHELAIESWPTGTSECAALLDKLEVPLDLGGRRVRQVFREAGHSAGNEIIAAAIRYRRRTA